VTKYRSLKLLQEFLPQFDATFNLQNKRNTSNKLENSV
jgi:hypothetical protein